MTIYQYTRELVNGGYNINNQWDRDAEGNQVYLYQEINAESSLSGLQRVKCDESICKITFNRELTEEEKTLLDNVVTSHKSHQEGI